MSSPETALERRVAQLERSQRRLQGITFVSVALLVAAVSLGMAADPVPPQTVVAKSIQLLDDAGRLRILINARAGVSLLDEEKRPRAVLSLDRSGPGLALYGTSSRAGTLLNVNAEGPALSLRDNAGRTRALLAAIDQGPALILSDENERERIALTQRSDGVHAAILDAQGGFAWQAP
jgi:hypothetical protein